MHDALVIGGGHNGLTCACYLARAGLNVLVLEANAVLGGLTITQEITRPGFHSDLHAFGYQFASLSPAPRELGLELDLLRPEIPFGHHFPDGTSLHMGPTVEDTCSRLGEDARAWETLFSRWLAAKEAVAASFNAPPVPLGQRLGSPEEFRAETQTMRDWAAEWFRSEQVRMFLGGFSLHANLSPDEAGGGQLAWLFDAIVQDFGNRVVRGGMSRLVSVLQERFLALGGEIRTSARVRRILVSGGKAVAVKLEDGTEIPVGRVLASNVDPRTLIVDLLGAEAVGEELVGKLRRYVWGDSIMVLYCALDRPVQFRSEALNGACYVHCTPGLESVSRMFAQTRAGELPDEPVLIVCNDGAADPSRLPPGKGLMKVLVKCVPYELPWDALREAYADRLIDLLDERYMVGLKACLLDRVAHTPVDQERHISSAVRGTELQGAFVPYQSGCMRPVPELAQYRTPVSNVFMCCSGSHPGPGVSFMPGRNAARAIAATLSL